VFEQLSASKMGDEQEFMKALILMAATLQAENYVSPQGGIRCTVIIITGAQG
jgi:hypothetical protein